MDKGISMNGQPMGGVSMNGQPLPVANATPVAKATPTMASTTSTAPMASTTRAPMGVAPAAASYPMHQQEKVGAKCCGCCCDFRRAVLILDVILMVFAGVSLIGIAIPADENFQIQGVDDDQVVEVMGDSYVVSAIINGVGMICLAVPVYGAITFNARMVAFGIVWLVASFIASIIVGVVYNGKANEVSSKSIAQPFANWIGGAIWTGVFIYPHVGLISEIQKGIMSQQTYPREEHSCCCGPVGR